jgi:hypothetical protein
MKASVEGPALRLAGTTKAATITALSVIAHGPAPDAMTVVQKIENKETDKFDNWLSEPLLDQQFVSSRLDFPGAVRIAARLSRALSSEDAAQAE